MGLALIPFIGSWHILGWVNLACAVLGYIVGGPLGLVLGLIFGPIGLLVAWVLGKRG